MQTADSVGSGVAARPIAVEARCVGGFGAAGLDLEVRAGRMGGRFKDSPCFDSSVGPGTGEYFPISESGGSAECFTSRPRGEGAEREDGPRWTGRRDRTDNGTSRACVIIT